MSKSVATFAARAALLAVALGIGAAGCSRDPVEGALEAVNIPKVNRVDWKVERHPVEFGVGSQAPAPGELQRLDAFLAGFEPYGARVFVDPAPEVAGGALAERRLATVIDRAGRQGFTV